MSLFTPLIMKHYGKALRIIIYQFLHYGGAYEGPMF